MMKTKHYHAPAAEHQTDPYELPFDEFRAWARHALGYDAFTDGQSATGKKSSQVLAEVNKWKTAHGFPALKADPRIAPEALDREEKERRSRREEEARQRSRESLAKFLEKKNEGENEMSKSKKTAEPKKAAKTVAVRKSKGEWKPVCRYCGSKELSPSFIARRDARCTKCFKERYGSKKTKPARTIAAKKAPAKKLSAEVVAAATS